jgi:hypothetical protein
MDNSMPYHVYMQCDYLRITPEQHKKIRQIVGFNNSYDLNYVGPFTSEPIDMNQALEITEYLVGEVHNNWLTELFKDHGYKTKPLFALHTFITFLLNEFNIGADEQGKRPKNLKRLSSSL